MVSAHILLIVAIIDIMQAILLCSLLLFHPKSDPSSNRFLALYILSISLPMLMPLVQYFFSWQGTAFVDPFLALVAPSLYLYIRSFKEVITARKTWPHFVFFAINILIDFWFFKFITSGYPASQQFPDEALHHPVLIVTASVRIGQMLLYFILSRKALLSYQRSIRQIFSETSQINLNWVSWLINGYLVLVIFMLGIFLFILTYPQYFSLLSLIHSVVLTPYIYIIAYKGIAQPTLWQTRREDKSRLEEEMKEASMVDSLVSGTVPKKSDADKQKWNHLAEKIVALLEQQKIYQEPELTLQQLGDRLQTHSYQVSQALNEGLGKNFYDLVNGYRVEEAKRLLIDPKSKNYTILSVGFEAGFNSKTTFNTVFKKFTGMTPTEFRDKN